ncbi:Plasma membrane fusion protein PRM1 [Coprinopsis cinerea AmutBmut pab1-1]|nr:Plasma membrane fusion protein PRM1 [Coprinopsis cinerea AmutBmut pab1-1]
MSFLTTPPNEHTTLTSYLQLPHLLSLTWLAYPILSLIFVAFRLQASLASSEDAISSAKSNLLASCKAAEEAATSTASLPRYMAIATNQQVADAVNATLRGARAALILTLTVMEAIINFIIDLYRSIFLCFLELVVRGGIAILVGAVEEINNVLATVTSGLRTQIQASVGTLNNALRETIEGINRINPFGDIPVPTFDPPNLDGLDNVSLPDSFQESLLRLNDTIPTVSTIKEKLQDIIGTPFELVKRDINDTFAAVSFSADTLPVPEQNKVSFCSDLDLSVVDDVGNDIVKSAKIGIVILLVIALVLIGLNCLFTWYKWRCMQAHLEYTRQAWNTDPTMQTKGSISATPQIALSNHNLMVLQANSEHPLVTRITNQLSQKLRLSPRTHTHMQWFFNYIFHPPAAACLLIGVFGLLLIEIQLLAMGPLVNKYQEQAAETTKDFSLLIANSINESMLNQSTIYAAEINGRVDSVQTTINDGLFGWVDGTIVPLNTTINEFYDDIQNAVQTVFGGTILETAATEFIRCLIGSKVDAVENALTFLHENLRVDMPRVNDTALMLSPESVNEASAPIAAAAMGGGTDDDQGLIGRLVNSYADSLRKERVTFGIFLALWGVVVLMGLFVLFWHSTGKPLLEKRRRRKYEKSKGMLPEGGFVVPYRDGSAPPSRDEKNLGGGGNGGVGLAMTGDELPQFTPLPSPRRSAFKPFWNPAKPDASGEAKDVEKEPSPMAQVAADEVSKLKAFRLKLMGKSTESLDADSKASDNPPGLFGKVKGVFGKKDADQAPDYWTSYNASSDTVNANTARPNIRVIVDTDQDREDTYGNSFRHSADIEGADIYTPPPNSRWSTSPGPTKTSWNLKKLTLLSPKSSNNKKLPAVSGSSSIGPIPPVYERGCLGPQASA